MDTGKRKIAIFTGNRAEYGLQYPIISAIASHPKLDYYLFVSGAHLDEDFGYTRGEIEKDGFRVWQEIKAETKADDLLSTNQAIGHIILNLSEALSKLGPDVLVVYADRFEGFAAVIAGSQMGIPVAHIEGGDITSGGALDDSVRHSMTKLSHLHFTTNEEAARRIERLGEQNWRIFNAGYPLIDLIKQEKFATLQEIQQKLPLNVEKPVIIFTQHSITTELGDVALQIEPSLEALKLYSKKGVQVIITYPNNDAGGRRIIKEVENLSGLSNVTIVPHLGRHLYHGILNLCGKEGLGVCVGNSSSGIKETPEFGCPFVHIGSRQKGRLSSTNIIDTDYDKDQIVEAIEKSLFDTGFRDECRRCKNPYGEGNAGRKIAETLASIRIDKNLIQKNMTY